MAAAFDLSYQDLTGDQQRLFRRLGLHPGTDIDALAAAALDDTGPTAARRSLAGLFDQHLVTESASGRYRMHDLIREHARALALTDDAADREAAVGRLTEYYVGAAAAVGRHFNRGDPAPGQPGAELPQLATREAAALGMEAERANMHKVVDFAALRKWPGPGIAIAAAMSGFLRTHGHWTQMRVLRARPGPVPRPGYRLGQAHALNYLGIAQYVSDDYLAADSTMGEALQLYRELGHRLGQAEVLNNLGELHAVSDPGQARSLRAMSACRHRYVLFAKSWES